MALKSLSVVDSDRESYSPESQPDNYQSGFRAQMFNDALFNELCLPFDDKIPGSIPREPFPNDDYEIALVHRRNRERRTGSVVQPSSSTDRVFLLQLTLRELLDRLRTELSRSAERSMIVRFGDVRVNLLTLEVTRSNRPVVLTAREFKLLRFLIKAPGRVFTRTELLNQVWEYNNYPSTRTVDNHVCMLRHKLEPTPARPVHFLTVHGMGYKFLLERPE